MGGFFMPKRESSMLHGVDVHARYQAGLVASALPDVDFVITKATGGEVYCFRPLHFRFDR